jgi:hypothetical protein
MMFALLLPLAAATTTHDFFWDRDGPRVANRLCSIDDLFDSTLVPIEGEINNYVSCDKSFRALTKRPYERACMRRS